MWAGQTKLRGHFTGRGNCEDWGREGKTKVEPRNGQDKIRILTQGQKRKPKNQDHLQPGKKLFKMCSIRTDPAKRSSRNTIPKPSERAKEEGSVHEGMGKQPSGRT